MEGLKGRAFALVGILAVAGFWVQSAKGVEYQPKTEKQLEQMAPPRIDRYSFAASLENPEQSYKMDEGTYKELHPYGIVCRQYQSGDKAFDVVLIASANRGSFHDPRTCFKAQGWEIVHEENSSFQTASRGTIPCTIVTMDGQQKGAVALYFYRGPKGFHRNVIELKLDLFKERLLGGKDIDGVFYRIIPMYPGATIEETKEFAARYLESSEATSQGYF